jgi:tRNA threonylcarbamoyladenosine biosynthesis protein TsaE
MRATGGTIRERRTDSSPPAVRGLAVVRCPGRHYNRRMASEEPGAAGISVPVPSEADMAVLAAAVAAAARPGDLIALSGPLGAGKTTFARHFLEARARTAGVPPPPEVPSPTFTLVQAYEIGGDDIWHFDLYRIAGPDECAELGFDDALDAGIVLVEWPDRLGSLLPAGRLDVALSFVSSDARTADLAGSGPWAARVAALTASLRPDLPS